MIIAIIDLTVSTYIENCLQICLNIAKLVMISVNYHNIAQLLLLTIIVSSKNCTISITGIRKSHD